MASLSKLTSDQIRALMAEAASLRSRGRLADSLAPLQRAAALAPKNAEILHDLGLTLLNCRRPVDAAAALRRAIAANPRYAQAHLRLGMALEMTGDAPNALAAYERAGELDRSATEAHYRAALLYERIGRRNDAARKYRQTAEATADPNLRYRTQANALLIEERDAEAEAVLREWREASPEDPDVNEMLGGVLSDSGRWAEADAAYERAIASDPGRFGLYYDLMRLRKASAADRPLIDRMEAAAARAGAPSEQLLKLRLALGKARDDLGDYEGAMREFDRADEVRRRLRPFDADQFDATVSRIIERLDAATIARLGGKGDPDATSIFIVGMPRSGTTLLEQILSAHPDVAGAGELLFWNRRAQMVLGGGAAPLDEAFLRDCGRDHVAFIRERFPDAPRVTQKNPFDFLWTGLMHLALPRTPILHCRRWPIDTALSIHQTFFNPQLPFPTGGDDLVRFYRGYERVMAHWRSVLPENRFLEVDYETLTADPEPSIRRIVDFCGLSWNEACLHPDRNERAVKTPSKWQVRQPIGRGSVGRWRRYEPWLGPLVKLVSDADRRSDD